MTEVDISPGTIRARRRRARLKQEGVMVVELELDNPIACQLSQAAELANMPIGRLARVIIERHFEKRLGGRKRPTQGQRDGTYEQDG